MQIKIGELAKRTGCQVVTIRYYEKEGLLGEPERTEGNYRLYGEKDLERLKFIMHCRKHGMKLAEIRDLLAYKDKPKTDCAWITRLISNHVANVEQQIASLQHLKEHLESLLAKCSGGHTPETCGILQSLDDSESCCCCQLPLCGREMFRRNRTPEHQRSGRETR